MPDTLVQYNTCTVSITSYH